MYIVDFKGKLKAVTFSYDDGVTQDERLIKLFNKYGLKCTFNINHDLLGLHVLDFIQQQCEGNGDGEGNDQRFDADTQGVAHQSAEQSAGDEVFKVLKANPLGGGIEESSAQRIVLEGNGDTGHGHVSHEEDQAHGDQQQYVQLAAFTDTSSTDTGLFTYFGQCVVCQNVSTP